MRFNEIALKEDVVESKDIMTVAHYVARWMTSAKNKQNYDGQPLTLKQIEAASGVPTPVIESKTVRFIMFRPIPNRSKEPLKFVSNEPEESQNGELGAYILPPHYFININLNYLEKRKKSVASVLAHEIDHALIDFKSRGQARGEYPDPSMNMSGYLAHPMEVNARFQQALWDLATNFETVARSDVYKAITTNLEKHKLNPNLFSDPKQYRKLISRAYKFLVDVSQIIDKKEKPGFIQTVKNLIKKWLI